MTDSYSEYERKQIAQQEYNASIHKGLPIKIGSGKNTKLIGTVRQVITDKTGLNAYVVESPDKKTVSILYKGSEGIGQEGSKVDWIDNDIPMAKNITTATPKATSQLKSAAKTLNKVLEDYPNAKIDVYGHSLGSMDAQYALANVSDVNRISGAYVYEGPNTYPALTDKQKAKADALKYRIHNYIDPKDFVTLGYVKNTSNHKFDLNSQNAVGIVYHVDSKSRINPVEQHMWGGYQWNSDGSLQIESDSSAWENKYSSSLDAVSLGMYNFSTLKSQRKKDGKLSKNETFFLDSVQAGLIAQGLVTASETVKSEVETAKKDAVNEAEELFQSTKTAPWGISELSIDEIQEAFAGAGVTYDSIVTKVEDHFAKKGSKVDEIATAYSQLETKIQTGINDALAADSNLAQEFNQWSVQ
ncbi:Mbeg1-like protein [Streptococcus loxodontisalivarius]|uniref:Esterase YcpF (UPF0227 family) n=1 Tax=Streptococcus loxodontisalivarius TaxID=1349415 RepID=A0ABS2PS87_9STRE|nr:Mbeg1-like protein [Streptococcus loxodontisalivarius]MBM7642741.1 putative esterase YcpF (UPF0227 family) [Streptococcus loxodontisalivarius]